MKKEVTISLIFMLMLVPFVPVLGASTPRSTIPTYGVIEYIEPPDFEIGMYTSSGNFREYDAATIASHFDMSQSWWGDSTYVNRPKMAEVHALNQNYKFLIYRSIIDIYSYWSDEWSYANSKGWLLKDINGDYVIRANLPQNYGVDITNPEYQQWLGAKVKLWLTQYPEFDGVMVDNSLIRVVSVYDSDYKTRSINPSTGTYFTDQEIWNGCAGCLNAIIDAIGTDKLVLPNGIWNGKGFFDYPGYQNTLEMVPRLNALGSEGIFYQSYNGWFYTEADWVKSVNMLIWVQDNFLSGHPDRHFNGWVPLKGIPSSATPKQMTKFGYCSMMLGVKYSGQNSISLGGASEFANVMDLVEKLDNLSMGEPLNNYYKLGSVSVYSRDFAGGKVLVNPTSSSYSVSLSGAYIDAITGQPVGGTITVPAYTGVILKTD